MKVIVGMKGATQQRRATHVLTPGAPAVRCGTLLTHNARDVIGQEVSCEDCARIAGVPYEPEAGRFWTSAVYGRVTLAEFDRLDAAAERERQREIAAQPRPEPLDFGALAEQAWRA